MLTPDFLESWDCPPALHAVATTFHALAVERFGGDVAAHRDALAVMEEVLDDPMAVLLSGAAHDLFGVLEPQVRDFAAAVEVERHPGDYQYLLDRDRFEVDGATDMPNLAERPC